MSNKAAGCAADTHSTVVVVVGAADTIGVVAMVGLLKSTWLRTTRQLLLLLLLLLWLLLLIELEAFDFGEQMLAMRVLAQAS